MTASDWSTVEEMLKAVRQQDNRDEAGRCRLTPG